MESWAGAFLSTFGARKSSAPRNLEAPVQIKDRAEITCTMTNNRVGSGRRTDEDLCQNVLSQLFCAIDWNCKASCSYGKKCCQNPGFLPFALGLRKSFWGEMGHNPPTTSERQEKAEQLLKSFQVKTPQGDSYAHKCDSGKIMTIPICEHIFFVALGGGKTKMWYKVQKELCGSKPIKIETETARAAFKRAKVTAYIRKFLNGCDRPPSKHMTNMYILPFPSVEQFYNEYLASFKPNHLAAIDSLEAVTETIDSQASLTTFRDVFSKEFAQTCKFMRSRGNHTSCEVCINAATLLAD